MADNTTPAEEHPALRSAQSSVPSVGGGERRTWPELVGVTAEEAERKVKEEMPSARVQVVPPDFFVTMDFRTDRVRLFIDSSGKVATPPTIG